MIAVPGTLRVPAMGSPLRSARLAVPLCVLAALLLVRPFDAHLYDFLGHVVLAIAAMMLLGVAGSSYARDSDGFFRYLGYALPWFAILQFAEAFVHARGGHGVLLSGQFSNAAHALQAAILAGAALYAGRRATVGAATLPWTLCSLTGFALLLKGVAIPAPVLELAALGLLSAAVFVLARRRDAFDAGTFRMVLWALLLTLAAQALVLAHGSASQHSAEGAVMEELPSYVPRLLGLWLLYVAGLRSMLATTGREAVYERMFQDSAIGLALTRMDGSFVTVNAAFAGMYGYESAQALAAEAKSVENLYAFPEERKRILETLRHDGVANGFELRMRRRDGSLRWMRVTLVPVRNRAGETLGLHAAVRDITEWREAAEKAAVESARLKKLVEVLPIGVWLVDEAGKLVLGNQASQRIWGASRFTAVEDLASFKRWWLATGEPVGKEDSPLYGAVHRGETRLDDEFEIETFDGDRKIIRACAAPIHDDAGRILGGFVLNEDITAGKRQEEQLRRQERYFRTLIETSSDIITVTDADWRYNYISPALERVLGYRPEELIGRRFLDLTPEADRPAVREELARLGTEPGASVLVRARARHKNGTLRTMEITVVRGVGEQGEAIHVLTGRDVTERKRYEERIAHLASHDALTGLPNRALLRDRAEQAISHARRAGEHVGLLFLDLDRFKLVNDSWGHSFGDALIVEAARRLNAAVRDGDTVARLGGDEFVILLPQHARGDDGARVASKAAAAIGAPFQLDGREILCTASIGISVFPNDGEDVEALLRCADAAMYRAKDLGRNAYQFYRNDMGVAARERAETEAALRQALARGELRLHYQPQVALGSGRVTGFEALMRWERPGAGLVSPAAFVPVAEDSGLIVPMGQWALHEACRQAADWRRAGFEGLKVGVNLSAKQFARGSVVEAVRAALAESGLPAALLEVEITESAVMQDLELALQSLRDLRGLGVSVAIDDFGTGYSSLAYLRLLPINKVKIDKSFLAAAPADPQAAALVSEIVRLAHVLGLEVVAEGVERMEQAVFLRQAGCEGLQGYLFSAPKPPPECRALLDGGARLAWPDARGKP